MVSILKFRMRNEEASQFTGVPAKTQPTIAVRNWMEEYGGRGAHGKCGNDFWRKAFRLLFEGGPRIHSSV